MATTNITTAEAVELATAKISRLGMTEGIELLIIKGPLATGAGSRPQRPSADVDVLLRQGDLESLCWHLARAGWERRPADENDVFPLHSVTMFHPKWPIDIDVHWRYPGFERDPDQVFVYLWRNRSRGSIAGWWAEIPEKAASDLIQALHSLRAPWEIKNQEDLDFLATQMKRSELPRLLEVAKATGSLGPLGPFLRSRFIDEDLPELPATTVEWNHRLLAMTPGRTRLVALSNAPIWDWPRHITLAVCPSKQQLASRNLSLLSAGPGRLAVERLLRIWRFVSPWFKSRG